MQACTGVCLLLWPIVSYIAACGPTVLKYEAFQHLYPTERNIRLRIDHGTTGAAKTTRQLSHGNYKVSVYQSIAYAKFACVFLCIQIWKHANTQTEGSEERRVIQTQELEREREAGRDCMLFSPPNWWLHHSQE